MQGTAGEKVALMVTEDWTKRQASLPPQAAALGTQAGRLQLGEESGKPHGRRHIFIQNPSARTRLCWRKGGDG